MSIFITSYLLEHFQKIKVMAKQINQDQVIDYLEKMIVKCEELKNMEREKWTFQQVLKYVR